MRKLIIIGAVAGLVVGALPGVLVGFGFALFVFGVYDCRLTSAFFSSCLGDYGAGIVLFTVVPALISGAIGAAFGAFAGALLDKAITDISNRKKNAYSIDHDIGF